MAKDKAFPTLLIFTIALSIGSQSVRGQVSSSSSGGISPPGDWKLLLHKVCDQFNDQHFRGGEYEDYWFEYKITSSNSKVDGFNSEKPVRWPEALLESLASTSAIANENKVLLNEVERNAENLSSADKKVVSTLARFCGKSIRFIRNEEKRHAMEKEILELRLRAKEKYDEWERTRNKQPRPPPKLGHSNKSIALESKWKRLIKAQRAIINDLRTDYRSLTARNRELLTEQAIGGKSCELAALISEIERLRAMYAKKIRTAKESDLEVIRSYTEQELKIWKSPFPVTIEVVRIEPWRYQLGGTPQLSIIDRRAAMMEAGIDETNAFYVIGTLLGVKQPTVSIITDDVSKKGIKEGSHLTARILVPTPPSKPHCSVVGIEVGRKGDLSSKFATWVDVERAIVAEIGDHVLDPLPWPLPGSVVTSVEDVNPLRAVMEALWMAQRIVEVNRHCLDNLKKEYATLTVVEQKRASCLVDLINSIHEYVAIDQDLELALADARLRILRAGNENLEINRLVVQRIRSKQWDIAIDIQRYYIPLWVHAREESWATKAGEWSRILVGVLNEVESNRLEWAIERLRARRRQAIKGINNVSVERESNQLRAAKYIESERSIWSVTIPVDIEVKKKYSFDCQSFCQSSIEEFYELWDRKTVCNQVIESMKANNIAPGSAKVVRGLLTGIGWPEIEIAVDSVTAESIKEGSRFKAKIVVPVIPHSPMHRISGIAYRGPN